MINGLSMGDLRRGMWRIVDARLGSLSDIEEKWSIETYFEALEYLGVKMGEQMDAVKQITPMGAA